MIKRIIEGNSVSWLIFHIVLGILAGLNHSIITGWIYLIFLSTIIVILNPRKKNDITHYFFSYYVTMEVFARMLKLTPFIPVESGKYLGAFLLLLSLATKPTNLKKFKISNAGLAICLLSIPSIFLMRIDDTFWSNLVFCWFGIFDLGLFVIYFSNFTFSKDEMINMFKLISLPLVSMTAYLLINTPSLSELSFGITANAEASGGFGPNQVSSIYGIGIFIMAIALIMGYRVFKNRFIDMGVLFIFTLRGILTVSRGGIFSAALAIATVYMLSAQNISINQRIRRVVTLAVIGVVLLSLFQYVNRLSGNTLQSRYSGETMDVHTGDKQGDLETVTDGRSTIIFAEWDIFVANPFLGVGPGQSHFYWDVNSKFEGMTADAVVASHTEFSRLLAEHGMFGMIISFIMIYPLWKYFKRRKSLLKKGFAPYINLGLLVLGLSMCMHSAMRTLITPFSVGFAFAGFQLTRNQNQRVGASGDVPVENTI